MKKALWVLCISVAISSTSLFAQNKILSVDDYHEWSRIIGTSISNDGNWMAYALRPNGGDDTLYVQSLTGNQVYDIKYGSNLSFSDDSKWAAYLINVDQQTRQRLARERKPIHQKAELLNLETGDKVTIDRYNRMEFTNNSQYWAVHRKKPDTDNSRHRGSDLIVRHINTGSVMNIGNVAEFSFNKRGDMLAYIIDADGKSGNGAYVMNLGTGAVATLDSDEAIYTGLTWDDDNALRSEWNSKGRKLALFKGHDSDSLIHRTNSVLVFDRLDRTSVSIVLEPADYQVFPDGMVISQNRSLSWSEDGRRLFLGIRVQEPHVKMSRDTIPNVDVWHWNDDRIQSVQMRRANADRNFTYLSVFEPSSKTFIQLADDEMRTVLTTRHNQYMVARDETPYTSDINWGVSPADLYRVNIHNGERVQFAEEINRPMGSSPDGRFYLYQKNSELFVFDLQSGTNTNISESAPVSFENTEHIYPHENPPYGVAGWTQDGRYVIVNHKYDLWMLALNGSRATNITQGIGDAEEIIFRYVSINPEERFIDTRNDLLLSAFGDFTKKNGFYSLRVGNAPRQLVYDDVNFGNPSKALNADKVILTRQTFVDFPDFYATNTRFGNFSKITDANPQQTNYAWGSRKLIDFETTTGVKLQGTLTLPANYEPGKRYPTLVYFYEKMSDRHNTYSMPVYDDRPHISTYASNGYLVFMPDVSLDEGAPGTSSLESITSAVNRIVELGYADPDRIGLQGHSWGGYQSSFILTQTDIFAAIVTGAPPTNLQSFYNNIYGSSGTVHHGIMEIGQVRMGRGVTPWSHPDVYHRENPMAHVPNINTPFMILHGTEDGAVDWSQGLELYNAARRNGKEVIFLSYPGEAHHLQNEANAKDFLVRMQQYFDYYLRGIEAPKWMTDGIPHLEKLYNRAE